MAKKTKINILVMLLIVLLTCYPTIELTRVILNWCIADQFVIEMSLYWLFYILALNIIGFILVKGGR